MNQEKKRILELVQNGKLSAQEAIILLEALEEEAVKEPSPTKQKLEEENTPVQSEQPFQSDGNKDSEQKKDTNKTADKESMDSADSIYSQLENAGERLFDFVQNAFNKMKDLDFQFNQTVEIPHTFQQSGEHIDRIDIDVANGPVRIKTWDQPEIRIECQAKIYRTEDREEARNYFLDHSVFQYENGLLIFSTRSKMMKVDSVVYIPEKTYKKLSIRVFNGGVRGTNLQAETVIIKTTNGKVELTNVHGEKLDLDTVNGQVILAESKIEKVEAETVNGIIKVDGTYKDLGLQSLNGNIDCILTDEAPGVIETKSVTGNIHITLPRGIAIDGDVQSNVGNYNLQLNDIDIMHEKNEIIQKQVKFKRSGTGERRVHLFANTKTGSVYVREVAGQ
ncbi:DUF4097 family beta strand repeat-containing protein [Lederbergia sp. NSJ-179]|uniref:DUF4097 family beta strand repeat-containing protein n=1 Tax=Lederbergia sp. NSJ-179 TaxID=2931402 RepID=UPI001FD04A83|nr:DUF4097 domain-containing protein [Lederbergia sp. NSJ-179]MCJ7840209.1 DUF4097 family beta strand repeat-containing protein [Lederbergia sp. NSJ-179]